MKTFGDRIKKILKENGYNYRIRVFPRQDKVLKNGKRFIQKYEEVVIYAGRNIEKVAQRRSRKLIAWKNEKGEWEGDLEVVEQQGGKGSAIYLMYYNDRTEPVKHSLYSDLWEEDEKEFGGQKEKLLEIMKNWKFQEVERAKLKCK